MTSRASSYVDIGEGASFCDGSPTESVFTNISHLVENALPMSCSLPQSENLGKEDKFARKSRPSSQGAWSEPVSEIVQLRPLSHTCHTSDYAESRSRSDVSSSSQEMSENSIPPVIPKRPSLSVLQAIEDELHSNQENSVSPLSESKSSSTSKNSKNNISLGSNSDDSMSDIETVPVYHEVDQNHESTYEPKKSEPPQVIIGRKIFSGGNQLLDSLVSSSNDEDRCDQNNELDLNITFDEENEDDNIVIEDIVIKTESSSAVTLTPKSPKSPMSPFLISSSAVVNHSSSNVSAIATLPRVKQREEMTSPLQLLYSDRKIPHDKPPPVLEPYIVTNQPLIWVSYTIII